MPSIIRSFLLLPLLIGLMLPAARLDAQVGSTETVSLNPPARLELVPVGNGPLLRGREVQFSLRVSGTPEPVNIWSLRIDYTTDTLTLHKVVPDPQDAAVTVSDPYQAKKGFESRSLAGMSITGKADGEVARLIFRVKADAPAKTRLALADHPVVREKLAHDDKEMRKTYDYQRVLVFDKVSDLSVADPPRK